MQGPCRLKGYMLHVAFSIIRPRHMLNLFKTVLQMTIDAVHIIS